MELVDPVTSQGDILLLEYPLHSSRYGCFVVPCFLPHHKLKRSKIFSMLRHAMNFRHPSLRQLDLSPKGDATPLPNEGAQVFSVQFSVSDKLLAASFGDGSIRIYNVKELTRLTTVGGPAVTELDDDMVMTSRSLIESRPGSRKGLAIIDDSIKTVTSVRFRPIANSHDLLLAVDTSGTIQLWGGPNQRTISQVRNQDLRSLYACEWSRDGSRYAVGGQTQEILLYDAQTNSHVLTLESAASGNLGKTGDDQSLSGHTSRITAIRFVPDAPDLIVSAGWDENVLLWDMRSRQVVRSLSKVQVHADALEVTFNRVVTGSAGAVQFWDFDNFSKVNDVKVGKDGMTIFSLATDKDGKIAYGGGAPGEVGFVPVAAEPVAKVTESSRSPFTGSVWAVGCARQSNLLACGTTSGYISVFDTAAKKFNM